MDIQHIDYSKPIKSKPSLETILIPIVLLPGICVALVITSLKQEQEPLYVYLFFALVIFSILTFIINQLSKRITLYPDRIEIYNLWFKPKTIVPFKDIIYHDKQRIKSNRGKFKQSYKWEMEFYTQLNSYSFDDRDFENLEELHKYLEHYVPKPPKPELVKERENAKFNRLIIMMVAFNSIVFTLILTKEKFSLPIIMLVPLIIAGIGFIVIKIQSKK